MINSLNCEGKGITIKIIDMDLENISLSELRQIIIDLDPYIIGITSLTCNHINAINIARTVKSSKMLW